MHHKSVSQTPNVIIFVFYAQVVMKSQVKNVTESDQVSVVPMVLAKNCLSRCQEGSKCDVTSKNLQNVFVTRLVQKQQINVPSSL